MPHDEDIYADEEHRERRLPALAMLRRLGSLLAPHKGTLAFAGLLIGVVTAAELAGPLLVRHVLDHEIPNGDTRGIVLRAMAYAGLFVVGMATAYYQVILLTKMGLRIVTRLRERLFEHVLSLSLDYFDKNSPGKLMARVESDVERLLILFSEVALALFRNGVLLLATLAVMMATDAKITLTLILILSPLIFVSYFVLRYIRKNFAVVRRMYARISGFLTEYVQGIPILQIYGYTEKAQLDLARLNQEKYAKEWRVAMVDYGFWALFMTMEVAAVMGIIYVGSRQIVNHAITIGTLILFIEYTRRLFFPLLLFSEQLSFIQRAVASADRVFSIFDTPSKTPDRAGARPNVDEGWGEISFENVGFSYDGGVRALEGVSFRVRRGEKVALVGLSGGGKSTLTKLLLRYHEPTAGRIALDGVDIRDFRQKAWRKKIGLVLQDIHLFPGTVGDNLRVLKDEIPDDGVRRAVRVVHAEEMIRRLPQGYDTELSEGGANLSMGERQMICFARAIVEDPDILVLDEATSSVDPATERRIQESLDSIMEGRTSIIVAHRLATIVRADRILVLNEGRLVEEGTHTQLYGQGGIYRDLFDLQFAQAG